MEKKARSTKAERQLRADLKKLSEGVLVFLACMDEEMKGPSTVERGKNIAKLCNELNLLNDGVIHFGLNISFPKLNRLKEAARKTAKRRKEIGV